jgi:hypothetical protein
MSCSKILLGDLLELTYEIIKYFQNDYSTLYSCILVNRLWCRLAIPLLWENPFSILTGNYNFIEIYSYNLNDCLKSKLNEYQIIDYLLSSKTLFNYPGFIRYLSLGKITSSIERWVEANVITSKFSNRYPESLFEFKRLIEMSLTKLFIENETNLDTFEITYCNKYCNNILELILQNPNFIYNIRNLKLYSIYYDEIYNQRSYITKKKISLVYDLPLYQSLLLSKDFNCSNALNTNTTHTLNFLVTIFLKNLFIFDFVIMLIHYKVDLFGRSSFV